MVDPSVQPYYQRLEQNPDDAEALFFVWQWHGDRGEFQDLAHLAEQVASRRIDPSSAADLFFRAGELWAKNLGRHDKAVGSYRRAYELDGTNIAAMEAARSIFVQLGNFKLAAQLFERQLGITADPAIRLNLLRELAQVRAQMGEPSGQAAALEEVIKLVPDDYESMRELATAYLARAETPDGGDPDRMRAAVLLVTIARALGGEHTVPFAASALDAWPGDESAFVIVRDGYAQAGRTEELALRQIQFLEYNPDSPLNPQIRKDLAELYFHAEQFDDAIAALLPLTPADPDATNALAELYRRAHRPAELVALLGSLPPAEDPAARIAELREIAELSGQQGDRDGMFAAMRGILALHPIDPEALALVEEDLRARHAFADLRDVLYAAAHAPDAAIDAKIARLRAVAEICDEHLTDVTGAVSALYELLDEDSSDGEAIHSVDAILTRAERWDDLSQFIQQRAEGAIDPDEARALWLRLGEMHREQRNDRAGEADALTALWEMDPDDNAIGVRLIDARRALGDVSGVTEILRARAENAAETDIIERWGDLAAHLEKSGDKEGALHSWQHVVTLEPESAIAWESVERLLERTGRLDLLIDTLITHAASPAAGDRPGAIHARAAEVAKALGDIPVALEQAERALASAPDDENLATLLMDVYEASGEQTKLIDLLRGRIERTQDNESKLGFVRRMAQLVSKSDPPAGARLYGDLRELAKRIGKRDDVQALEALCAFAESRGDHARLAGLLSEWAEFVSEVTEKRPLYLRRADVLGNVLKHTDQAITTLQKWVTDFDGKDVAAWAKIGEFALATGKHVIAADALERHLALLESEDEKAAIAARLADLCEHELKDIPRTLLALEAQYDADPTEYTVVSRLAKLYEQQERWSDVVKYLEVLAEIEENDEQLSVLTRRIADIFEQKLDSARKAFDVLKPLAEKSDAACLDALRGVATRAKLVKELLPILKELAARTTNASQRAALWSEVAERNESDLDDKDAALEGYLRALLARPGERSVLTSIERLAKERNNTAAAAQAFSVVLAASDDPAEIKEITLRAVNYLEQMQAFESALDLTLASQGRSQGDDDLLSAIIRLAPAAKRGDEMFVAFDRRRNASKTDAERYSVMLRAAESAMLSLNDRETCFSYLRLAITQATGGKNPDESKLAAIETMARSADEKSSAAQLRSGIVELYAIMADETIEETPRITAMLLRRAAHLCMNDLDLPEHAISLLSKSVSTWPSDHQSASDLETVAIGLNRAAEVVDLYMQVIDNAYDAQTAREYQTRRANLLGDVLGRVDESIAALRNLIEIAPKDIASLRLLQAFLRKHKRHQDLLMALERELEIGAPDATAVRKEIARVWDAGLKNSFEAKSAWKQVLKSAPDDREARSALDRLEKKRSAADDDTEPASENDDGEMLDPDFVTEGSREIAAPPPDASSTLELRTDEFAVATSGIHIQAPPANLEEPSVDAERTRASETESEPESFFEPTSSMRRKIELDDDAVVTANRISNPPPSRTSSQPPPDNDTTELFHRGPIFDPQPAPTGFENREIQPETGEFRSNGRSQVPPPNTETEVESADGAMDALEALEAIDQDEVESIDDAEEIEADEVTGDDMDEGPSLDALAHLATPPNRRAPTTSAPPPPSGPVSSKPPPSRK